MQNANVSVQKLVIYLNDGYKVLAFDTIHCMVQFSFQILCYGKNSLYVGDSILS